MTTSVSVSGSLLSALIHESLRSEENEELHGLLFGVVRENESSARDDDETATASREAAVVSYAVSAEGLYDWSGAVNPARVEALRSGLDSAGPGGTTELVGWWTWRRAPPAPSLRDAAVHSSLEALGSPLVLLSISMANMDVRYRFSRRRMSGQLEPVDARTRVLAHDSWADLRRFEPGASVWSAFRSCDSADDDPATRAFAKDRKLLDDLLDALETVEREANNLQARVDDLEDAASAAAAS